MNGNANKKSKEMLEQKRCDGNEVFLLFYRSLDPHHMTRPTAPTASVSPTFSTFPWHRFLPEEFFLGSFIIFQSYLLPYS